MKIFHLFIYNYLQHILFSAFYAVLALRFNYQHLRIWWKNHYSRPSFLFIEELFTGLTWSEVMDVASSWFGIHVKFRILSVGYLASNSIVYKPPEKKWRAPEVIVELHPRRVSVHPRKMPMFSFVKSRSTMNRLNRLRSCYS